MSRCPRVAATGPAKKGWLYPNCHRNVLIDEPEDKTFTPLGDARWKVEGDPVQSREMYFATYQTIARDKSNSRERVRPGSYNPSALVALGSLGTDVKVRGSEEAVVTTRVIDGH